MSAPGESFNLDSVAATVEDIADPIAPQTPWVDEGDISVPGAAEKPAEDDAIGRVAKFIGIDPGKARRNGAPRTERAKRESRPIPPKPRQGQLVKQFTDLYVGIGTMMMPFDSICGQAVIASAPKCAESLENLARENPAVRRALMALVETSVWGAVITAHAPILLAVAMHHVPAVRNNMPTPVGPSGVTHGNAGHGPASTEGHQ